MVQVKIELVNLGCSVVISILLSSNRTAEGPRKGRSSSVTSQGVPCLLDTLRELWLCLKVECGQDVRVQQDMDACSLDTPNVTVEVKLLRMKMRQHEGTSVSMKPDC